MTIQEVLQQAEESVRANTRGELSLGWRYRLWDCLNEAWPDTGVLRRGILAYRVVQYSLGRWDPTPLPEEFRDLPQKVLALCKAILLRRLDYDQARYEKALAHDSVLDYCDYSSNEDRHHGTVDVSSTIPLAAYAACLSALGHDYDDTHDYDATDYDCDPDDCDAHFWVSVDNAKGASWEEASDPKLRRQFWVSWIREEVPLVLKSGIQQVIDLLE